VLNGLPIFSPDDLPGLVPWAQLQQSLGALHVAKGANDVALIRGLLQQLVAGYEPAGEVVEHGTATEAKAQIIRNCAFFSSKMAQLDKLRQNCANPNLKLRQHHHVFCN